MPGVGRRLPRVERGEGGIGRSVGAIGVLVSASGLAEWNRASGNVAAASPSGFISKLLVLEVAGKGHKHDEAVEFANVDGA